MWQKIKCFFGFHDYKITETYIVPWKITISQNI